MSNHRYNQYCGLAYAMEIIGERWTMLIVRELMAGPRRFKDLVDGLPGISTNLLTERLKALEGQKMLTRYLLPPPAGSTVYELTELGRSLETALLELGRWGSRFVPTSTDGSTVLRLGSYALTLKTFFRAEQARGVDSTYEIHVNNEVLQAHIKDGDIEVMQGRPWKADAVFTTDMESYLGLLTGRLTPEEAIASGNIKVDGKEDSLDRFISICGLPAQTSAPA